jgi:hypothetical protein
LDRESILGLDGTGITPKLKTDRCCKLDKGADSATRTHIRGRERDEALNQHAIRQPSIVDTGSAERLLRYVVHSTLTEDEPTYCANQRELYTTNADGRLA